MISPTAFLGEEEEGRALLLLIKAYCLESCIELLQ